MTDKYNCPNCGAPIGYTDKCEYCGTVLNWIPTTTIEYIPMNLNVRKAEVTTRIPREYEAKIPVGQITADLSKRMADFIIEQKAFELSMQDDFMTDSRVYRMRTLIGVKR